MILRHRVISKTGVKLKMILENFSGLTLWITHVVLARSSRWRAKSHGVSSAMAELKLGDGAAAELEVAIPARSIQWDISFPIARAEVLGRKEGRTFYSRASASVHGHPGVDRQTGWRVSN
ncbi:hypothetical protein CEP52_004598 [Fusarium oligoseptatum]|uniref:Uncharacterized protein n=1 Tax=Fusarium oligoseptatum TaxID=2604345 RepID=A0A428U335_9HYPO|nr:hypothetical protein CEP52_004598 [Fusarium oligoseptatum]